MKIKWPAPYPGAHWLDEREDQAVLDVLHRRSLFRYYGLAKPTGVATLEAAAQAYYPVKHALGVNSGTGALFTAMTALQIGPGDEVILPAFFWVATVGAVVQANAIPVLCEVDDSFTLDPADLARKITPRTRLIVAVHMAGAPCNIASIMNIARARRIPVLEDCAQANGASFRGQKVGTFGAIGIFSLQWNKNATAGEGGLLITNSDRLFERVVAAHDVGVPWVNGTPCDTGAQSRTWGGGRRMGELTGAVGAVQLTKLPQITQHMRDSKRRIKGFLRGSPGLSFRRLNDEVGDSGPFLILLLKSRQKARDVVARMQEAGLTTAIRLADYGLHIYYNVPQLVRKVPLSPSGNPWNLPQNQSSVYDYRQGACPQSDGLFGRSILLPIPSRLTKAQEKAAAEIIRAAAER
jgi:8-amino-3,8-dideoxy-alpha-D-manno-octulosonate transaminase